MEKKLIVDAVICDLRKVQEETLAKYESIAIDAAVLVTNARARALLAEYPFVLDCASTVELDDETTINVLNGKTVFTGSNTPHGRQYLIVNGILTIMPDAGDALRQYMGMIINGKVYCPDTLVTTLTGMATINGKILSYPAGAVVLKNNAVIDRAFALRAESRTYWAANRLIAVDEALDGEALAEKGVRFCVPEAYLTESLAESMAPLFDADTRLILLPDGVSIVQDDLSLNAASLRRYGDSLLVLGDLYISGDCAGALEQLEFLQVKGDIYMPETLAGALDAIPDSVLDGEVYYLPGKALSGKSRLTIDKALLEQFPEGLSAVNCAKVTLASNLSAADILDKLSFFGCASVNCPASLKSAVQAVSTNVAHVGPDDEDEDECLDENAQYVDATVYTL